MEPEAEIYGKYIETEGSYTSEIPELIDKTFKKIYKSEFGDALYFETVDGELIKMHHIQDCCESVVIEDIVGDLSDIVGKKIVKAEETTSSGTESYGDSFTWTFYHITAEDGSVVTLRWYGTSNGYYSESVSLTIVKTKCGCNEDCSCES